MKVIKETTLHPEGNDGVDLYPKTSIKQVENLSDTLTGINQTEQNLALNKLDKPATPTVESAVIIGTDGTVSTKVLSELGGKLYRHTITINFSGNKISKAYITLVDNYDKSYDISKLNTNYFLNGSGYLTCGIVGNGNGVGYMTYYNDGFAFVAGTFAPNDGTTTPKLINEAPIFISGVTDTVAEL